jgi:hypothetical protein
MAEATSIQLALRFGIHWFAVFQAHRFYSPQMTETAHVLHFR